MRRTYLLTLLMAFMLPWAAFSQQELSYKDETPAVAFFPGEEGEAGIVVSCPNEQMLIFNSTTDAKVDVYKTEQKADGRRYFYLRFPTGRRYDGRILEIMCPGFKKLSIPVKLTPKQRMDLYVYDPNGGGGSFYETKRSEGDNLFRQAFYDEALIKYKEAQGSSNIKADEKEEINERVTRTDSVIFYRQEAERNYLVSLYNDAIGYYRKVIALNGNDEFSKSRIYDCTQKLDQICTDYWQNAERLYKDGDYNEAYDLYSKVKQQSCGTSSEAIKRMAEIDKLRANRRQRAHVLTYEYSKDTPWGISTGNYKRNKFSGYFTFRVNSEILNLIRADKDNMKTAEMNISFGWTRRVAGPVWVFFGPGYTGQAQYERERYTYTGDTDGDGIEDEGEVEYIGKQKLKLYHAVTPEVGLLGKIGPLVLRYTFQYNFVVSKDYEDRFRQLNHVFGIGVCF